MVKGRVVNGLRVERRGDRHQTGWWRVTAVVEPASVKASPALPASATPLLAADERIAAALERIATAIEGLGQPAAREPDKRPTLTGGILPRAFRQGGRAIRAADERRPRPAPPAYARRRPRLQHR
jgi:hypothetical protein